MAEFIVAIELGSSKIRESLAKRILTAVSPCLLL